MMLAMVLAMGTTAGAVELETSSGVVTNSADVEIKDVPNDVANLLYTTYQVISATYNSTSNSFAWQLTEWAKDALVDTVNLTPAEGKYSSETAALQAIFGLTGSNGTGIAGESGGTTTTEQNDIVNTLAAYIASHSNNEYSSANWTTTGTISSATLPVGAYLVIPSATNYSFLNMLVSVDVADTTGSGGSTAKDGWVVSANGAVLKGNKLIIEKTVSDSGIDGTYGSTADAQIGTKVYYQVKVYVPKFAKNDSEKVFTVADTATNLKIDLGSVEIYAYDTNNQKSTDPLIAFDSTAGNATDAQYVASVTDTTGTSPTSTLTVIFSNSTYKYYDKTFYSSASDSYPYEYVIITYEAELLDEAVVTTRNANGAALTYDYDNHESVTTAASVTNVYTYELDLTKYGEGTATKLANASFELTDGTGNKLCFIKDNSASTPDCPVYRVADSSETNTSTVITTGTEGVKIIGLDESVAYTIGETVAPSGYTLNTNTLTFTITDYTASGSDDSPNGIIDVITLAEKQGASTTLNWSTSNSSQDWPTGRTWNVSLDTPSATGIFGLSLTDTKISALPATGSIGIIVFTIAGVAIMILALVLINSGKSKQKKA